MNIGVLDLNLLSVETHVSEDSGHLELVVLAHVLPDAENDGLEDTLNVVATRRDHSNGRSSTDDGGAAILDNRLGRLVVDHHLGLLLAFLVLAHLSGGVRLRRVKETRLIRFGRLRLINCGLVGLLFFLPLFFLGALLGLHHRLDFEFKVFSLL